MKRFTEQLHKKATTAVKMQAAEKRELRERVVAYMEYHPLPTASKPTQVPQSAVKTLATEAFTTVKVPFQTFFKYGSVAAAVILVAVPFLAERAVPGDTLYAVKVQFNEELRSTLTFDSYQKVEWETERLNRRIAEARLLASEGRLTEEVEAEVAAAVREHTENAKREIEVLRGEDADDAAIASIALDTTLEVQSNALKGDEEKLAADDEAVMSSRSTSLIATAIDESREVTMFEQAASSTLPAYAKLMARIEQNTTRIYELRQSLSEVATKAELSEVTRRIQDIERSVAEAVAVVEADEMMARQSLVEVLQRTQKLIVFIAELEVTKTVDIETLVPVVLTDAEKQTERAQVIAELEQNLMTIDVLLPAIEDEGVAEKVLTAQEQISGVLIGMKASSTEYRAFKAMEAETVALVHDVLKLLEAQKLPVELPAEPASATSTATSTETEVVGEQATSTTETTTTTESINGEFDLIDSATSSSE
ncbi:hypothetical protein KC906_04240, partial [Candidatus Kaiserbacteria bacterium]|nr:hypothetical protein [Candidatus Kaiserbacteria bacterium]